MDAFLVFDKKLSITTERNTFILKQESAKNTMKTLGFSEVKTTLTQMRVSKHLPKTSRVLPTSLEVVMALGMKSVSKYVLVYMDDLY